MREDPDHPILSKAWTYDIVGFNLQLDAGPEPFLDLTLRRGAETRRLRFLRPQSIVFETGAYGSSGGFTYGLAITDISGRGLENLRVEVHDYEGGPGDIRFHAREVVDLDAQAD